jgi:ATP-dependent Clp protease ATP-binding subunit ClpB
MSLFDQKIYRTALDAARRKFSPEFLNRIDKLVVFRSLTGEQLERILEIELAIVQDRIIRSQNGRQFVFHCTQAARNLLLEEGTDLKYGARHLRRAIQRFLVYPLSNLVATGQVRLGDVLKVDVSVEGDKLLFSKPSTASAPVSADEARKALSRRRPMTV